MIVMNSIFTHRSIRRYKLGVISGEQIHSLLNAAMQTLLPGIPVHGNLLS
jgi:hypothetical protein